MSDDKEGSMRPSPQSAVRSGHSDFGGKSVFGGTKAEGLGLGGSLFVGGLTGIFTERVPGGGSRPLGALLGALAFLASAAFLSSAAFLLAALASNFFFSSSYFFFSCSYFFFTSSFFFSSSFFLSSSLAFVIFSTFFASSSNCFF